jgi:hypothetical protein
MDEVQSDGLMFVGCPHCVNRDHGFDPPFFLMRESEYKAALDDNRVITCKNASCGRVFKACDAQNGPFHNGYLRPLDDDGELISPMWCHIECECMPEGVALMVWAKSFLRAQRYNLLFPCPKCKAAKPARDYKFWRE